MRSAATGLLSVSVVLALGPTAGAEGVDRPRPSAAELAASITDLDRGITDLDRGIVDVELDDAIQELDSTTTEGDETVIALTTDVLFDFGKADLPANAAAKIEEVLAEVPQGTTIRVEGHTDSIGADDFNQRLSEDRAEAVATAIREVRPDLDLEVQGFGESQPVAPNEKAGEDNPDGRAQNRRVEIRYVD